MNLDPPAGDIVVTPSKLVAVTGAARGLGAALTRRLRAAARRKLADHRGVYTLVNAGTWAHRATVLAAPRSGMPCLVDADAVEVVMRMPGQLAHQATSGPLPPLPNGATFAGFRIVRPLGSGGMGEVYLVEHPRLPRQEALKVMAADVSGNAEYRSRFIREADLAAALWHPHIVGVHDRGEHAGRLWLSMDYVDGSDCARLLRERYPAGMPRSEVVEIVGAVARALDYAHDRGVLHRDVKPANILLTKEVSSQRRALLTDFGIARRIDDVSGLTATNMTLGTVDYTAPEQLAMDSPVDGRADQYALAATAFHLLTGAPPFAHANPAAVISGHLNNAVPAAGAVRPELADHDAALRRALAKHPHDRFDCCQDFADALRGERGSRRRCRTSAAITRLAPVRSATAAASATKPPVMRPATVVPTILALMLIASIVFVGIQVGSSRQSVPSVDAPPTTETIAPTEHRQVVQEHRLPPPQTSLTMRHSRPTNSTQTPGSG
jgi:serine/threonine protein kinase